MEFIYKKLEQNEISMCADTLMKAFKEEPWNEHWTFEQACTRLDGKKKSLIFFLLHVDIWKCQFAPT